MNGKKKGTAERKGRYLFGGLLLICLALAVFSAREDLFAEDYIAVLEISGRITTNDGATYDQQYLLDSVEEILHDEHNKALLLRIDTAGGAVYETDELYQKLMEYRLQTGRLVCAAIESYGASGGYYLACAADEIFANRNALTGSIGVIIGEFVDVSGLLEQLGVDVTYITSGPNKSMGSSYQPMTEEQRAIYQSICDEYFDHFVTVVANGRAMDEAKVRALADGRIYTASQAVEKGLIDGIATYDKTLQRMRNMKGDPDMKVKYYCYRAPSSLLDYLAQGQPLQFFSQLTGKKQVKEQTQWPQILMYYSG